MFIDMNEPDRLELVEVYERGRAGSSSWRTFEVGISPPGVDGYRNVWIDDPSRGTIPVVSYISPQTEQILGNWKPVNASEADYILRFDETKKVVILIPELSSGSGLDGEFEWVGENRLRLTFNWYFQPAAIEDGVCTKYVPSLFKQFCQHNLSEYDASGYPEPPVYYPSPYSPPTSMPTPAPGAIDTIDEVFKVEIDGETLALIYESGARLTLQKLIGK